MNGSSVWNSRVDAVRVLGDMIGDLTDHRQDYRSRKVYFAMVLTRWLVEHAPQELRELFDYVRSLLVKAEATGSAL